MRFGIDSKTEADINDSELQHGEPHMVEVLTDDGEPVGEGDRAASTGRPLYLFIQGYR